MDIIREPSRISGLLFLGLGKQLTFHATGLAQGEYVQFEIVELSRAPTPPSDYCCTVDPDIQIVGTQPLRCPDGRLARLTSDFPVGTLDGPQGVFMRAVVVASPASVITVTAAETDEQSCTSCICSRPCEVTIWTKTGARRCNAATGTVDELEQSNCGDERWTPLKPITWVETGVVRCTNTTVDAQETNDCGELRWVEKRPVTWIRTGNKTCVDNSLMGEERNDCGLTRWVVLEPVTWTKTGATRCDATTVYEEEISSCCDCKPRWVEAGVLTQFPTGRAYCRNDSYYEIYEDNCGRKSSVLIQSNAAFFTGDTRCNKTTHRVEEKWSNPCGVVSWRQTAEECGYCASYPLPTGGYGFVQPADMPANVAPALLPCENGAEQTVYLYQAPATNGAGYPIATLPVKASDGTIIGYAVNQSDCAPILHPVPACEDCSPLQPKTIPNIQRNPNLTPTIRYDMAFLRNYPGQRSEIIVDINEIAGVDTTGQIEVTVEWTENSAAGLRFDYEQSTSQLDGSAVDNATWDALVTEFPKMTFKTNQVIKGGKKSSLAIGVQYIREGYTDITVKIKDGSGSETIFTDNIAVLANVAVVAPPDLALSETHQTDKFSAVGQKRWVVFDVVETGFRNSGDFAVTFPAAVPGYSLSAPAGQHYIGALGRTIDNRKWSGPVMSDGNLVYRYIGVLPGSESASLFVEALAIEAGKSSALTVTLEGEYGETQTGNNTVTVMLEAEGV